MRLALLGQELVLIRRKEITTSSKRVDVITWLRKAFIYFKNDNSLHPLYVSGSTVYRISREEDTPAFFSRYKRFKWRDYKGKNKQNSH